MKYLLLFLIGALTINAETYTIQWQHNDKVQNYSMDVGCIETGFSSIKRFSGDKSWFDVDLSAGLSYRIVLYAYDKDGSRAESNVLIIKTLKEKTAPKLKAPEIKAIKRD